MLNLSKPNENYSDSSYQFQTIEYEIKNNIAYIILNRPKKFNAIIHPMPFEIQEAVRRANLDSNVKVIIVEGKNNSFCSGYDLHYYAESKRGTVEVISLIIHITYYFIKVK